LTPITAPESIIYGTSFASDTLIAETSDEVFYSVTRGNSSTDGNSFSGGEVPNVQEDFHRADAPTTVDRYFKQKRSALGKVAYVVFSGRDAGVFYNWYVFISHCNIYQLSFCLRTAASAAIYGLEDTNKVYKGYSSCAEAL
jgi:hypothetical protein